MAASAPGDVGLRGAALEPLAARRPGARFDVLLIAGVLLLALLMGGAAAARPGLLPWVLWADLWLLAYPHVASTFTRIAFDRKSARAHWFLLLVLPLLVVAGNAAAAWVGGAALLNTIYFYWQSYHYARQSRGIAGAYRRAGPAGAGLDPLGAAVVYAFPVWGLVHRAQQHPTVFYGMSLWSPPLPRGASLVAGVVAITLLAIWTARTARGAQGEAGGGSFYPLFVLSHVVITVVSYVAIAEVTRGWLFINIWHNAQYLLFVWAQNARRFRGGVDPERPFVSRLSQPANAGGYAAACLGLSTGFYLLLGRLPEGAAGAALPVVLVVHQSVNFHHYLVDSVIWRSPSGEGGAAR